MRNISDADFDEDGPLAICNDEEIHTLREAAKRGGNSTQVLAGVILEFICIMLDDVAERRRLKAEARDKKPSGAASS